MAVVTTERRDGVLTLCLNRPEKLNAMNAELIDGVLQGLIAAVADPDVRVIVLTGAGRAFCAGGDLTATAAERDQAARNTVAMAMKTVETYGLMEWSPKPVIAQVNGLAYAGGLGFVVHSDIAVAADTAVFCAPMARRGLYEPYLSARLAARIGIERAKYLLMTTKEFTAAEALSWGMVSEVHPVDELPEATAALADRLVANDAYSLREYKHTLRRILPELDLATFVNDTINPRTDGVMARFAAEFPDRQG